MKVAISVPDPVYRAAERAARRLRVKRSHFYSMAAEAYARQTDAADITARLNAVHEGLASEPDAFLAEAARRTFRRSP